MNSKNKKGFTLAEVLITLSILGVVAAIIIPGVYKHYQNLVFYSQLRKTYATLQEAYSLYEVENAPYSEWIKTIPNSDKMKIGVYFADKIAPYLDIKKTCNGWMECWGQTLSYMQANNLCRKDYVPDCEPKLKPKLLNQKSSSWTVMYTMSDDQSKSFILKDGTVLAFGNGAAAYSSLSGSSWAVAIIADINGAKGPNMLGRDVFAFGIEPSYHYGPVWSTPNTIVPAGYTFHYSYSEGSKKYCDTSLTINLNGFSCAARVLIDDKGIKY